VNGKIQEHVPREEEFHRTSEVVARIRCSIETNSWRRRQWRGKENNAGYKKGSNGDREEKEEGDACGRTDEHI
jgi:hypothetical protein